jgi:hypothetical protein
MKPRWTLREGASAKDIVGSPVAERPTVRRNCRRVPENGDFIGHQDSPARHDSGSLAQSLQSTDVPDLSRATDDHDRRPPALDAGLAAIARTEGEAKEGARGALAALTVCTLIHRSRSRMLNDGSVHYKRPANRRSVGFGERPRRTGKRPFSGSVAGGEGLAPNPKRPRPKRDQQLAVVNQEFG